MKYGIVLDAIFTRHNTPAGHPERPQRIEAILQAVKGWNPSGQLVRVAPLPAQEEWLLAVHTHEHWQRIQGTSGQKRYLSSIQIPTPVLIHSRRPL